MAEKIQLDVDLLQSLLRHDEQTGLLYWRVNRGQRIKPGDVAGSLMRCGYIKVTVCQRHFLAHRLAWAIHHGAWPGGEIDHINGDKTDNRIENLRDVSRQVNMQNIRQAYRASSHGVLGVTRNKRGWMSQISHDGAKVYLGTFGTQEEAHAAYIKAKRDLHPGGTL